MKLFIKRLSIFSFLLFTFSLTLTAQVKTGIEVLRDNDFAPLKGKKIGLITNATGVDYNLKSTIDILHSAMGDNFVALFAPEHGVRGDVYAGEQVTNYIDKKTGIKVYSLYGKTQKPTADMLKGIDILVYDIQDIGCRSYTFISTMGLAMEAAAEQGIEMMILDRPNPLGGLKIEGAYVENKYISFVSQYKIPYLYALTAGELARLLNEEGMISKKCKLTVIPMNGWKREMLYTATGLPWVMPSPHIPTPQTAYFYPATGILGELNMVSIGVGYTLPFHIIAHTAIDAVAFADSLNKRNIAGVSFRPITYRPFYNYGAGKNMSGVQLYITDYNKANLSELQFLIIKELSLQYPQIALFNKTNEKRWKMFDNVCGSSYIRKQLIKDKINLEDIKRYWRKDVEKFRELSEKYYLYH